MKYLVIFFIMVLSFSLYQTTHSEEWTDYNTHDPGISQNKIPEWIKNNAEWWSEGLINDKDFLTGIQYLIDKKIITVDAKTQSNQNALPFVPNWIKDTAGWWSTGRVSDADFVNGLTWLIENGVIVVESHTADEIKASSMTKNCSGEARCFIGTVTTVIDGDTIKVDGKSIRFALASAPELYEFGGSEAKELIQNICPVGSTALVDEDDGQTHGSYGRIIGVIYCNILNLNAKLLDEKRGYLASEFCSSSEFAFTSWAQKHGCLSITTQNTSEPVRENECDMSYPDVCIPSPPPDLDCTDISYRNFKVLSPDPHRFDGDKDGIGCER
ncbi:MAG: hypothetical protein R3327_06195 [Nitrosopumilaceae archaeon]|nr:hypothetical protein [Nitrosopumilaceae archaeon]